MAGWTAFLTLAVSDIEADVATSASLCMNLRVVGHARLVGYAFVVSDLPDPVRPLEFLRVGERAEAERLGRILRRNNEDVAPIAGDVEVPADVHVCRYRRRAPLMQWAIWTARSPSNFNV